VKFDDAVMMAEKRGFYAEPTVKATKYSCKYCPAANPVWCKNCRDNRGVRLEKEITVTSIRAWVDRCDGQALPQKLGIHSCTDRDWTGLTFLKQTFQGFYPPVFQYGGKEKK
jgi:hypothetical protein